MPYIGSITERQKELFWKYVKKLDSGCWEWQGFLNHGYGQAHVGKRTVQAHRLSYVLAKGEIPDGAWLLHSCDNPKCVNPDHLRPGTPKENHKDMWDRKRAKPNKFKDQAGSGNYQSKLSEKDVIEIRNLVKRGEISYREIARRYKISPAAVTMIHKRITWAHLEEAVHG